MTEFIAAYDVENADLCPKGLERIVEFHESLGLPATFFIVGKVIEQKGTELKRLLDRPWADLQSHTYSHKLLKDSRMHGPGVPFAEAKEEIERGKKTVEDLFGRPCVGVRSGCGFDGGLAGRPDLLKVAAGSGLRFVSTDLRGPADSIPAPLKVPYTYAKEGFPRLLELPCQGWHDNVLKALSGPKWLVLTWPPVEPWFIPAKVPETPEEEADVYHLWIDKAVERGLPYVSLAWHPWSHFRFSPDCRSVRLTLEYVKTRGLPSTTCAAWVEQHGAEVSS